ncbi:MAG: ATP-binding cassette domain-containing protein [Gemmatimonadetes bacterium]|nr:ATP-binding cassette domain-containing protein [Gemmatimonadota bacterium]
MISVRDLAKVFQDKKRGPVRAVDGVSFDVGRGEIYGLLGPNGAGKTTTLRILATVLAPSRGSATLDGLDIFRDGRRVRQRLGFLSGDMGLYHRLTPRELVAFFGRLNSLDGARLRPRMDELFSLLGIHEFADTKIDKLSTGMRQRVAIARTLVHDPPVLILYSTHVMEEAECLCDRIGVIHRGKIRAVGTIEELRARTGKSRLREIFLDLLSLAEGDGG